MLVTPWLCWDCWVSLMRWPPRRRRRWWDCLEAYHWWQRVCCCWLGTRARGNLIYAARLADVRLCVQVLGKILRPGDPETPTLLLPQATLCLPILQANLFPRVGVETDSSEVDWPAQRWLRLIFRVFPIDKMRRSSFSLTDALLIFVRASRDVRRALLNGTVGKIS